MFLYPKGSSHHLSSSYGFPRLPVTIYHHPMVSQGFQSQFTLIYQNQTSLNHTKTISKSIKSSLNHTNMLYFPIISQVYPVTSQVDADLEPEVGDHMALCFISSLRNGPQLLPILRSATRDWSHRKTILIGKSWENYGKNGKIIGKL